MKRRFLLVFICVAAVAVAALPATADEDGAITDRVRQRLVSDPDVKGYNVEVETKNGVVTLAGTVDTERAKLKAEKLVKKVRGVKSVVNNLRVEIPRPRS